MRAYQYKESVEYLDDKYCYFVTHVLNIGKPRPDFSIPTACVAVTKEDFDKGKTDNFYFAFNPDFADKLDTSEGGFILAHETMHIILNHLKLSRWFDDPVRFNLAADAVINDYLVGCGLDQVKGTVVGDELVGYNCSHATVSQVYDDIPEETVEKYKNGQGAWIEIDDHTWIHVPDSMVKDVMDGIAKGATLPRELEDIKEDINSPSMITRITGKSAGSEAGEMRKFMEDHRVGLAWAKLLRELDPDMFRTKWGKPQAPAWHRKPRKLYGIPEVILPIDKEDERSKFGDLPMIFMALDTSGSIGEQLANRFVNLARSIPQTRIKVMACTFTTTAMELDLDNPRYGSGGTAFSPIEEYIQANVMPANKGKYPKAVVVMTDGEAGFYGACPTTKDKESWVWLMCPGGKSPEQQVSQFFGRAFRLTDFEINK